VAREARGLELLAMMVLILLVFCILLLIGSLGGGVQI
jgi:hypothetical protein